jgi:hypothetical protein
VIRDSANGSSSKSIVVGGVMGVRGVVVGAVVVAFIVVVFVVVVVVSDAAALGINELKPMTDAATNNVVRLATLITCWTDFIKA